MRSLVWDQRRTWEDCGTGSEPDGLRDNVRCLKGLICHQRSGVCRRCVHLATWGASVGRSYVLVPRSCRLIPISGSSPVEQPAMGITEASCYEDSASSLPIRVHWVSCLPRLSFDSMGCMAMGPSSWISSLQESAS